MCQECRIDDDDTGDDGYEDRDDGRGRDGFVLRLHPGALVYEVEGDDSGNVSFLTRSSFGTDAWCSWREV